MIDYFSISWSCMTDLERFNLYWLCHAMTTPMAARESHYYDSRGRRSFTIKNDLLIDMLGLKLLEPIVEDLDRRLKEIDGESSEILEIPQLNVQEKVAVQLLFLSKFPNIINEEKLRLETEKQQNAYGFVLDKLEAMDEALAPLAPYWDDFKLKTIQFYLEKFTGIIGITFKMFKYEYY